MPTPATDPLLRLPAVQCLVPLSKGRIYGLIAQGRFPAPVAIGANAVGWKESEVRAYLERVAVERALRTAGVRTRRGPAPMSLDRQAAHATTQQS